MNIKLTSILRELRREKEIKQETLAEAMGVSVQAVSKWETGMSYPDIQLLPDLARYFGVTVDYLLTGEDSKGLPVMPEKAPVSDLGDSLQVVVAYYRDGEMLRQERPEQPIELGNIAWCMGSERSFQEPELHVSIYGNAEIAGKINGSIARAQDVYCEKVNGSVMEARMVETDKINGNVQAQTVRCGEGSKINGNVEADVVYGPFRASGDVIMKEKGELPEI
ncbi:MAG: helix-turn-helix transcriptional regulator [Lachnospiraceae bacterium]|jgi:transcriptional regulator with XRE-family HTH domain|nr:helix-turn-helix transcriptional regulator [Lachnospiraceae bacterium]